VDNLDIARIYGRFRVLMPDLPEDYREGLTQWQVVVTRNGWDTSPDAALAEMGLGPSAKMGVHLFFINGLEYHGSGTS